MNFLNYADNKIINFNKDNIFEKILDRYRWPIKWHDSEYPSIESIDINGNNSIKNLYNEDGFINSESVIEQYESGNTLILSRIQFLFKEIYDISHEIKKELGYIPWANIYMSKGKKKASFNSHNHYYPVMVKNVAGVSKWIIAEQEILLKGQDVLYFPENTYHEVVEIIEPKISITFNL